jgi:hypothetical protein
MSPVIKKRKLNSVSFHPMMQVFEWDETSLTQELPDAHLNSELEHEQEKSLLWYSSSDLHRMKQEAIKHALCIRNEDAIQKTLTGDQTLPTYSNVLSSAYQWCCDTSGEKHESHLPQNHMFDILANALISHSYRDARGLEFQSVSLVRTERALRRYAVRTSIVRLQQQQNESYRKSNTLSPNSSGNLEACFAQKFRRSSERGSLVAQRWAQLMAWSDALEVASSEKAPIHHKFSKIRPYCVVTELKSNPHVGLDNNVQETLIPTSS